MTSMVIVPFFLRLGPGTEIFMLIAEELQLRRAQLEERLRRGEAVDGAQPPGGCEASETS